MLKQPGHSSAEYSRVGFECWKHDEPDPHPLWNQTRLKIESDSNSLEIKPNPSQPEMKPGPAILRMLQYLLQYICNDNQRNRDKNQNTYSFCDISSHPFIFCMHIKLQVRFKVVNLSLNIMDSEYQLTLI